MRYAAADYCRKRGQAGWFLLGRDSHLRKSRNPTFFEYAFRRPAGNEKFRGCLVAETGSAGNFRKSAPSRWASPPPHTAKRMGELHTWSSERTALRFRRIHAEGFSRRSIPSHMWGGAGRHLCSVRCCSGEIAPGSHRRVTRFPVPAESPGQIHTRGQVESDLAKNPKHPSSGIPNPQLLVEKTRFKTDVKTIPVSAQRQSV